MMPNEINENAQVSFSVKELLQEQTGLLRGIDKKVDGKADKSDLVPIANELRNQHDRITKLEDRRDADDTAATVRASFRKRMWIGFTAVIVPLGAAVILVWH